MQKWSDLFAEQEYNTVAAAVKALLLTRAEGYPPNPGEVMAQIQQITTPPAANGMEAWGLVMKAIRNSTYNFQKEFENLPDDIQKALGTPEVLKEWAQDLNFNLGVAQSNFLKAYATVIERKKTYNALPERLRQMMIGGRQEQKAIGGGQNERK